MLFVIILLTQAECSFALGTMGNEFLVSLPGMLVSKREKNSFPSASMYLLSLEFLTKVHMSTEWYDRANGNLKQVLYVEKGIVTKFTLPPNYLYGLASGMRWSIHFLSNLNFAVTVELFHNFKSSATLQLLPVAAWGERYFAVTLAYRPVIIVSTAMGPNAIRFYVKGHFPTKLVISTGMSNLTHGSTHEIILYPYHSYALSACDDDTEVGPITGTEIVGQYPIGVVSGNCYAGTEITYCDGGAVAEVGDPDILAEMLMPIEAYGSDFITFDTLKRRNQGQYIMVASANDTRVTVYISEESKFMRLDVFLKYRGNWKSMKLQVQRIYTSQPIQLVLVQQSTCLETKDNNIIEDGGPTLSVIVPTNLFYFEYTWGTPYELGDFHFIILVVRAPFLEEFIYNGVKTAFKIRWRHVYDHLDPLGTLRWKTGMVSALSDQQQFLHNPKTNFGCYLYGFNQDSAYMHPVGYIAAHINTYCYNSIKQMEVDDLKDNDCDLRIDEEFLNGIDDDDDRFIDEDLRSERYVPTHTTTLATVSGNPFATNQSWDTVSTNDTDTRNTTTSGVETTANFTSDANTSSTRAFTVDTNTSSTKTSSTKTSTTTHQASSKVTETTTTTMLTTVFSLEKYTPWSSWRCDQNCYETRQKRTRTCLSEECTDQEMQWREHNCYINETCPKMCGEYSWGINCRNSCANCISDCDKFNGSCKLCLPFYAAPTNGCQTLMFGVWQSWTCSSNCNNANQMRERICQKSEKYCTTIEWRNASCHRKICPRDCLLRIWGPDCSFSCPNCDKDCDKFNGTCARCKPGFKNPNAGCVEECGRFTYGQDCKLSCLKKCDSDDCAERKTGQCPVHGKYGEWNNWHCTRNCLDNRMSRERSCDRPPPKLGGLQCQGQWQEWRDSSCYSHSNKLCPSDCPEFLWGVDCEYQCTNCMQDCDKFNGNCTRCKRGYKYPDLSCVKGCGTNEYGYNCVGNCHAKCGSDCKERVHGYCKDPSSILIVSIFAVFVAILIVVCLIKRNMASDNSIDLSED